MRQANFEHVWCMATMYQLGLFQSLHNIFSPPPVNIQLAGLRARAAIFEPITQVSPCGRRIRRIALFEGDRRAWGCGTRRPVEKRRDHFQSVQSSPWKNYGLLSYRARYILPLFTRLRSI